MKISAALAPITIAAALALTACAPSTAPAPTAPASQSAFNLPDVLKVPAPVRAPVPTATAPAVAKITTPTAAPVAAPACEEDEPCWDCATMGNKICGPAPVAQDTITAPTNIPVAVPAPVKVHTPVYWTPVAAPVTPSLKAPVTATAPAPVKPAPAPVAPAVAPPATGGLKQGDAHAGYTLALFRAEAQDLFVNSFTDTGVDKVAAFDATYMGTYTTTNAAAITTPAHITITSVKYTGYVHLYKISTGK